jgi:hypothetical protein
MMSTTLEQAELLYCCPAMYLGGLPRRLKAVPPPKFQTKSISSQRILLFREWREWRERERERERELRNASTYSMKKIDEEAARDNGERGQRD